MSEMIYFAGENRNGVKHFGYTHVSALPSLVEQRFRAGWRLLTVRLGGRDGVEVGRIERAENGRRVWWVDDSANPQVRTGDQA